ncbi:MAG: OmpW family protein [Hyphomicrobiaceae bacterium]|nr:OmpW family protein [Hyphomicrobiaceae bacterium]
MKTFKAIVASMAISGAALTGAVSTAAAGDYNGDFMVRIQGTYLNTDDDMKSAISTGAGNLTGAVDTYTTNSVLPTATLTYFFNKNIAAELFCCFAKSTVKIEGAVNGEVGDTWMFPPIVTLQYHFTDMGPIKPYVGVGAQWIHFFSEDTGKNATGATSINIDDAFGIALQAGVDIEIGSGWYLNADVKKSFLDTQVTLTGTPFGTVRVEHDLDPWIFSVGVGYRFNLFGPRYTEPLK